MRTNAMGKEAETKTETRADLAVAQDDSVALAALRRRQSSAGFAPPDSELRGRRGSSVFGLIWHHFAPRGEKLSNRPKPLPQIHLRTAVDRDLGGGAGCGPRRGNSGAKRHARGRGFGFEFGRWLATSTEQACCRNPHFSGGRRGPEDGRGSGIRIGPAEGGLDDFLGHDHGFQSLGPGRAVERGGENARYTERRRGEQRRPEPRCRRLPLLSASGFDRSGASPTMTLYVPAVLGFVDSAWLLAGPGSGLARLIREHGSPVVTLIRTEHSPRAKARREEME